MTDRKPLHCGGIEFYCYGHRWEAPFGGCILQVKRDGRELFWQVFGEVEAGSACKFSTPQEAADDLAKFLRGLCGELVAGGFNT